MDHTTYGVFADINELLDKCEFAKGAGFGRRLRHQIFANEEGDALADIEPVADALSEGRFVFLRDAIAAIKLLDEKPERIVKDELVARGVAPPPINEKSADFLDVVYRLAKSLHDAEDHREETIPDGAGELLGKEIEYLLGMVGRGEYAGRNRGILRAYLGIGEAEMLSLAQAGKPYSRSRERIRQIYGEMCEAIRGFYTSQRFPRISQAIDVLQRMAPLAVDDATTELRQRGVLTDEMHAYTIIRLGRIATNRLDHYSETSLDGKILFVTPPQAVAAREIRSHLRRHAIHNGWGCISEYREHISGRVRRERKDAFIRSIARGTPGLHWINEEQTLFILDPATSRLGERIRRVFGIFCEAPLDALVLGISRSYRKAPKSYTSAPPKEVVEGVVTHIPNLSLQGGMITATRPFDLSTWTADTRWLEVGIVEQLMAQTDGVAHHSQLGEMFVSDQSLKGGFSRYAFAISLNHSPLLFRVKRGLYRPVGTKLWSAVEDHAESA